MSSTFRHYLPLLWLKTSLHLPLLPSDLSCTNLPDSLENLCLLCARLPGPGWNNQLLLVRSSSRTSHAPTFTLIMFILVDGGLPEPQFYHSPEELLAHHAAARAAAGLLALQDYGRAPTPEVLRSESPHRLLSPSSYSPSRDGTPLCPDSTPAHRGSPSPATGLPVPSSLPLSAESPGKSSIVYATEIMMLAMVY